VSMASSVVRERSDTLDDRVLGVTPLPLACALYIEGNLCDDHDDHGHMIGTAGKSTHTIAECFNWCNETAGCQVLTITFCHHLPLKRVPKALRHGLHAMLMLLLLSLLLSPSPSPSTSTSTSMYLFVPIATALRVWLDWVVYTVHRRVYTTRIARPAV
jgi:hypothetical protein